MPRVEDLMLIFGSVILISYFEQYINWFDTQIIMESTNQKTSVVVQISGGLHFIGDCRIDKSNKELMNYKETDGSLIPNPKGTYLVFSEPISPSELCFRVQELYAESGDDFLNFARWFPNCYLSQTCLLVIAGLIWAICRMDVAMLVGIVWFAEFTYGK